MQKSGEASGPGSGLLHRALIYGSDREFMDVVLPFVVEGLSSKEPTLIAVRARHLENLRSALGGTPEGVSLHPAERWYETSARTREKLAGWAAERTERAGRVRLVGEPRWALGHEAQVRDWARHESVINVAFAGSPVALVCAYDARALPDRVLDHARSTHPEIVDERGISSSGSYEDPHDFCRRLDLAVEAQPGVPALEIEFGLEDLAAVRHAVGSLALAAGLAESRTQELVLGVNEITTNAVIHGRPPATVRAWLKDGEIVVEVTDAGDGIRDVLAGQLTPPTTGLGGRGLWLTRLLSDAVEVHNGSGCTVMVHASASDGALPTVA